MESPTVEISHGLEALKLGVLGEDRSSTASCPHPLNGQVLDVYQPIAEGSQHKNTQCLHPHQVPKNCFQPVTPVEGEEGPTLAPTTVCSQLSEPNTRVPLLFSHLEHTTPLNSRRDLSADYQDGTAEDIIDSFNSLHVTEDESSCHHVCSHPHLDSMPPASQDAAVLYRTCRQELHDPRCLDDTTVDDLVGYFEQMLYLPRPMSDMAELMYT